MLAAVNHWGISEEGSASDHNIIEFHITLYKDVGTVTTYTGVRFIIKEHQRKALYTKHYNSVAKAFHIEGKRRWSR